MTSGRGKPCSIVSTGGRRPASGAGCSTRLQTDRDDEWHSIDSTINRAHQHSAGGKGGPREQGIGRSRGGLSTKVHVVVDALGLPLTFEITEGQRHDNRPAKELVAQSAVHVSARRQGVRLGCLSSRARRAELRAVIPSNGSRAQKLPYDKERYKARSEIECTFSLLKQARRFATRYEKTLRNYAAVVAIGCALLWLRI